jgi:cytochrome c5
MSTPAAAVGSPAVPAHDAHEHSSFIKTPQQLLVVLFLAFVVPIAGTLLLVSLVVSESATDPRALEPKAVAERLQPVGSLEVIDVNAPKVIKSGEEVVKTVCAACHIPGAANAPKIGDNKAWAPHIKEGLAAMLKTAITGKGAMPPRGGVPDLSDIELARAIVNMANQSGGKLKEPEVPAPGADAKGAAPTAAAPSKGSPASSVGTPAAAPVGVSKALAAPDAKAAPAASAPAAAPPKAEPAKK